MFSLLPMMTDHARPRTRMLPRERSRSDRREFSRIAVGSRHSRQRSIAKRPKQLEREPRTTHPLFPGSGPLSSFSHSISLFSLAPRSPSSIYLSLSLSLTLFPSQRRARVIVLSVEARWFFSHSLVARNSATIHDNSPPTQRLIHAMITHTESQWPSTIVASVHHISVREPKRGGHNASAR